MTLCGSVFVWPGPGNVWLETSGQRVYRYNYKIKTALKKKGLWKKIWVLNSFTFLINRLVPQDKHPQGKPASKSAKLEN